MFTRAEWDAAMARLAATAREAVNGAAGPVFDDLDLDGPVSLVMVLTPDGVTLILPFIGDAVDALIIKAGIKVELDSAWTSANPR